MGRGGAQAPLPPYFSALVHHHYLINQCQIGTMEIMNGGTPCIVLTCIMNMRLICTLANKKMQASTLLSPLPVLVEQFSTGTFVPDNLLPRKAFVSSAKGPQGVTNHQDK